MVSEDQSAEAGRWLGWTALGMGSCLAGGYALEIEAVGVAAVLAVVGVVSVIESLSYTFTGSGFLAK